jgi:type IV pilus assembly protein PilW
MNLQAYPRPAISNPLAVKRRQAGLTMVEIMVAITLGLILTAGVIQMFVSNKRAYQVQDAINSLQENGRFAMRILTDSLRATDHWGGVEAADVGGTPTVSGIGSCDSNWILSVTYGIRGYDGTSSNSPLPTGCINDADYVASSDVLIVRHAGGEYYDSATVKSGSNANEVWVRTAVGRRAELFLGSAITGLPSDLYDASNEDAVGLYNYHYDVNAYFIQPCSNKQSTYCSSSDDGGKPIPTLARLSLEAGRLQQQSLVSGIEQMQIEYGLDTNLDNNAEYYVPAAQVATSDWDKVVSARISLVVRANERGTLADTQTYTLPGGATYTPSADAQYYPRKVFTTVVQIRNRSRS